MLCFLALTASQAVAKLPSGGLLHQPLLAQTQPVTQAQRQAITLYQPLQSIQWEGPYISRRGLAFYALPEEASLSETTWASKLELEEALEMKDPRDAARILAKLGPKFYLHDDFDQAIAAYKKGLEFARESNQDELEGLFLASLGLVYAETGFYWEALENLNDYWRFVSTRGDKREEERVLGNLGNVYFGGDLYVKAIEFHQKRLQQARQLKDRAGEGKALGDLGVVYQALGNYVKALDLEQQQLTIARQIQDLAGQKMALANLGITYHAMGNYQQAIDYQQQRLTLARQTQDLKAEAEALANLAGAAYFLGDYNRAIDLYEQGWKIAWDHLHNADVLYGMRGNQGLAYLQQGNSAKALEFFQQYYQYVSSRNNRRGQGLVKNNAAVLRLNTGNLPAAEKGLREAIAEWESLRSRLDNNDTYKVSIFETQDTPYLNLQSVLLAQNQPEAALETAERGRARAFAELLARRMASGDVKAGKKPTEPSSPPLTASTLQQIRDIAKAHNTTLVEYSILSESFKIQGRLQTQESELLIWVIKPTGEVTLRRTDLKPLWQQQGTTLTELVSSGRTAIGVRGRGVTVVSRTEGTETRGGQRLDHLYQLLIQPIADLLPSDPTAPIVFIPQRSLFLVPFAALQNPQGKYLIEQHTVLMAPSIQVLDLTYQQRQRQRGGKAAAGDTLIVGNPTMPKVLLEAGQEPEQLPSLPGAEREARSIATLLKTQALTGGQATKAAVVQRMTQARLIHLATHGLLDDFKGMGVPGAIALAPTGQDNGLLTASEILNLKLQAELVVLSACNTGSGKITGDGVIGLSRSLMAAGTPTVIVSLWAVPDAPTAALMTEFYQKLQTSPNKAQALRQAMLTTLKQYPNPIDWAAFTLLGEPD